MSKMNRKTLCEPDGLLDSCLALERARGVTMTVLLVDQCSEICVCVLIALQDATLPVWTQYTVWLAHDKFVARAGRVLTIFGIQMLIETAIDWLVHTWIYSKLDGATMSAYMKRFVLNRSMVVFAVSLVAHMSIAFWPKCLRCDDPVNCLAFTECLRSGVVEVNGDDYCTKYPRNVTNLGNIVLAISHPWTNVSYADLGCDRTPAMSCAYAFDSRDSELR